MEDVSFLNNPSVFENNFDQFEEQQASAHRGRASTNDLHYYSPGNQMKSSPNSYMMTNDNQGSQNNSIYDHFDGKFSQSALGNDALFGYDLVSNGYEDQRESHGSIIASANDQSQELLDYHSSSGLQQSSNDVDNDFNEIRSHNSRLNINEMISDDAFDPMKGNTDIDQVSNMYQVPGPTVKNSEDLPFVDNSINTYNQNAVHKLNKTGSSTLRQLPINMYKLQYDPNPVIIKRMSNDKKTIYRQNINIRYLKPPKPRLPGPLIIREVRPPQPPIAPPLIIRQRPPRAPTPPPLILRERPPQQPVVPGPRVIKKQLPSLPPPARQVIIERFPQLPPKPRDIIVERWLPYDKIPKRTVIYQRAPQQKVAKPQKNVIVYYQSNTPIIQRTIRRQKVVQMDPQDYIHKYATSLLDKHSIAEQVHKAGIDGNMASAIIRHIQTDGNQGLESLNGPTLFQPQTFLNDSIRLNNTQINGEPWYPSTNYIQNGLVDPIISKQYGFDSKDREQWSPNDENSMPSISEHLVYDLNDSKNEDSFQIEDAKLDNGLQQVSMDQHSGFSEMPIPSSAFMHESGDYPDSLNDQFMTSGQSFFNQSGMNSIDVNSAGDNKFFLRNGGDHELQLNGFNEIEDGGHL